MKLPPPLVEGERLRLRPVRPDDVEGIFGYASDPEVCRYTVWPLKSREGAERHLQDVLARYTAGEGEIVDWAIERREDGAFLGKVSLHHADGETVRVGVVLAQEYWGKGFGREAVRLAMGSAFADYGFERVVGACHPDNERSRKLIEALGLRFLRRDTLELREGVQREMLIYELMRNEYRAQDVL